LPQPANLPGNRRAVAAGALTPGATD